MASVSPRSKKTTIDIGRSAEYEDERRKFKNARDPSLAVNLNLAATPRASSSPLRPATFSSPRAYRLRAESPEDLFDLLWLEDVRRAASPRFRRAIFESLSPALCSRLPQLG